MKDIIRTFIRNRVTALFIDSRRMNPFVKRFVKWEAKTYACVAFGKKINISCLFHVLGKEEYIDLATA